MYKPLHPIFWWKYLAYPIHTRSIKFQSSPPGLFKFRLFHLSEQCQMIWIVCSQIVSIPTSMETAPIVLKTFSTSSFVVENTIPAECLVWDSNMITSHFSFGNNLNTTSLEFKDNIYIYQRREKFKTYSARSIIWNCCSILHCWTFPTLVNLFRTQP